MGATRKILSIATFGLIDFRSDKERTARYTKQSYKLAKSEAKQNKETDKQAWEQYEKDLAEWKRQQGQ